MTQMKQLLQNLRTGETFIADVPVPNLKPGTALVRTAVSLVSAGTERMLVEFAEKSLLGKARSRPDLARQVLEKARREGVLTTAEAAFSRLDQPFPLGYASAGSVLDVGAGLQGLNTGQRVACAGGGYAFHAEYAIIPRNLLVPLPEEVDFESAAFGTLGAIALHGFRLSEAGIGDRVAVIGLGLVGLLATGIARAAGCKVLGVDLDSHRVALADQLGVEQVVLRADAESAASSFSHGAGFDAVLICADTPEDDPVELAGSIARDRGRVVAVGAVGQRLPRKIYYSKELTFLNSRSYGPGRYDPGYEENGQDYPIGYVRWTEGRNLEAFIDLLASGKVDVRPLITHRFPIEQAPEAYDLITGKRPEPFLAVLLTYPQDQPDEHLKRLQISPSRTDGKPRQNQAGKIRLGVLGAGNFAANVMLPAINAIEAIEHVGIISTSGLQARNAAERFHFQFAGSDEDQVLGDDSIDTVAIITRHDQHARLVIKALKAGKNVFCEKPLALTEMEIDEICAILGDLNLREASLCRDGMSHNQLPILTVGFNRRFAPLATQMKAFCDQRHEPLVAIYRINAGFLPAEHWLHNPDQGGGRIIGEACHFIDFLTFLVGRPPVSIAARGLPDGGRYHEDNVLIDMVFPDGSTGTIAYLANGDKTFPKEHVEIFTSGQVAVLEDFRTLELAKSGKRSYQKSRLRQDKGHRVEWEVFARAVLSGSEPPIPYEQLLSVSRGAIAAVRALRTGETISI